MGRSLLEKFCQVIIMVKLPVLTLEVCRHNFWCFIVLNIKLGGRFISCVSPRLLLSPTYLQRLSNCYLLLVFQGPGWSYETELPDWARIDWSEPDDWAPLKKASRQTRCRVQHLRNIQPALLMSFVFKMEKKRRREKRQRCFMKLTVKRCDILRNVTIIFVDGVGHTCFKLGGPRKLKQAYFRKGNGSKNKKNKLYSSFSE